MYFHMVLKQTILTPKMLIFVMENFPKISLDCWNAVLYLKKCIEREYSAMVQSEVYLITYKEYCCLLGGVEKILLKYTYSNRYPYNFGQYLTKTLFTIGWFRCIQSRVVHQRLSFIWDAIKKEFRNYARNWKIVAADQHGSIRKDKGNR